jgi:alginate biosynthesis protein AlgX
MSCHRTALGALVAGVVLPATVLAAGERLPTCPASDAKGYAAGTDGWIFVKAELMPDALPTPAVRAPMQRLLDALAAAKPEVVVMLLPNRPLAVPHALDGVGTWNAQAAEANHRALADWIRGRGLAVVDLLDVSRAPLADDTFFFLRDNHLTPAGARALAPVVASAVRALPAAATLPPATFQTKPAGRAPPTKESVSDLVAEACGTPIPPPQPYTRWTTSRVGAPAGGLLDQAAAPAVTLLGTSNAGGICNLSGFLEESLGTDILTVSTKGGGLLGSLQAYLRTPEWATTPPKIAIWEFSATEFWRTVEGVPNPRDPAVYRELIPSVYGGCSDKDAAKVGDWVPATGEPVLLSGLAGAKASGTGWYLLVESDDPGLQGFSLDLHATGGATDSHTFPPMTRNPTYGRFFLELSDTVAAPLEEVKARFDAGHPGKVRARLCRVAQGR